jgi:O-antigen/teichoic acid export membrane protein
MRLTDHLSKGAWAFADKSLPLAYSIGAILLIIRVLPKEEYGLFILIQSITLMMVNLSTSFSLVPMVKFASESEDDGSLATMGFLMHVVELAALAMLCWVLKEQIGVIFHKTEIVPLVIYIPLMAACGELRFYTQELLRARYRIYHIFWTDLAYFAASLLFVIIFTLQGKFMTGADMCKVTVLAFAASSVVGIFIARDLIPWRPKVSVQVLKKIAGFGKFTLGTGISNEVNERSDILLIGLFLNPAMIAVYTVAKILWRFFSIYNQVVVLLVLPGISRLHAEKRLQDIKSIYEKTISFSYLLLIPFGIIVITLAHPIIAIIYGERYLASVPILRVLALYAFFVAPASIGSALLTGIGKPETVFKSRWIGTVANIAITAVMIPLVGPIGAAIGLVFSIVVIGILLHRTVVQLVAFEFRNVISSITALPSVATELWTQFRHR